MTDAERLLRRAYDAFNARDIESALVLMHADVDWPNALEGRRERGHAAVRLYWTRQFGIIDPDDAQLSGNIANANDLNGIVVYTPSAKLTRNTASFNQSLGIDAQSGAVADGGGNKAVNNGGGASHQCENVVCTWSS